MHAYVCNRMEKNREQTEKYVYNNPELIFNMVQLNELGNLRNESELIPCLVKENVPWGKLCSLLVLLEEKYIKFLKDIYIHIYTCRYIYVYISLYYMYT